MAISAMLKTTPSARGSVKAGSVMFGTANQGAACDRCEIDQSERDRYQIADDGAQQDGQHAEQPLTLQIDREDHREEQGDERHQPVGRSHAERGARQGEADDDGDGTGDDGGQHLVQGRFPDPHDQQTDEDFQDARGEDAYLRQPDPFRAELRRGIIEARRRVERHDGDDNGDVAEAGAVVHRDAALGDQQRDDGADAAGEQRHADVELGEDGDEDGRREHGQHLLKTEAQHGADGWLVLGQVAEGGFLGFDCHLGSLLCAVVDEVDENEGQRMGGRGSAGLPGAVGWRGVSSSGITRGTRPGLLVETSG